MKLRYSLLLILVSMLAFSCMDDEWDQHYTSSSPTVDMKMWDALRDTVKFPEYAKYSKFVNYLVQAGYDSVLNTNNSFTLFVPDNEAFENYLQVGEDLEQTIGYHIGSTAFLPVNINGSRKLQTISKKYIQLSKIGDDVYADGINVVNQSPVFIDGIIMELDKVAYPRPNLYEYFKKYSSVMSWYIDQQDSLAFDVVNSNALGFDADGKTIYDSTFVVVNKFEDEIFPVAQEFRNKAATFIVFSQEQYEQALNDMAFKLGAGFNDYRDIPSDWQEDVLIPYYLETSVFDSAITYAKIAKDTIKNIWGDSVIIDHFNIDASTEFQCSNGKVFTMNEFEVPEKLYVDTIRIEGESLIREKGDKRYEFIESVYASSGAYEPTLGTASIASGEEFLNILLSTKKKVFAEEYYIEFTVPKLFPGDYKMRWRASNVTGGEISFWVNGSKVPFILDKKVRGYLNAGTYYAFENSYFRETIYQYGDKSVSPSSNRGWNQLDFDLTGTNKISQYGDVTIRVMYEGASRQPQGINIDYIELIPVTDK